MNAKWTPVSRGDVTRVVMYSALVVIALLTVFFYYSSAADSAQAQTGSVQIAGSETMRPVVAACAEEFMTRNPHADIMVKGGGSGDGIAALLHGIVDVGMSSRALSSAERDYAQAKGIEISMVELALDGIAVIVNRGTTIAALDLPQLRAIFAGTLRNWRELGGEDAEIVVVGRKTGSGTASLFGERVLGDDPPVSSIRQLPTNEAVVAEVASHSAAIGYSSLGAMRTGGDRIKVVAIRADAHSMPIPPTVEAIRSKSYPLARALYFGTAGESSAAVTAFIDFCSSGKGQALIHKAGYIGANPTARLAAVPTADK